MREEIIEWILDNCNAFTNVNGDLQLDITSTSELVSIREQLIDVFVIDSDLEEEFEEFWDSRIEKDLGYMLEIVFPLE